ncbi:hypothetical protein MOF23_07045 [Bacillus inaquosorum]|uniref:hypothetical protein n=1 Tax=Bacillus inaquosorum TaxID=483913 RepID=UPI00227F34F4|nr:hypothetical protein [Bacillus inaquosorum]MCY9308732.1 hypothetical protein [Bacillus inaquosorum]
MNNNTELFAMFTNSLNQQTQALQMAYTQAMQLQASNREVEQQSHMATESQKTIQKAATDAFELNQSPSSVLPAEPVIDTEVEHPTFIAPKSLYDMVLMIKKPCNSCPFASTCKAKPSHILPECNVSELKKAAIQGGEIQMKISIENMKYVFKAYKNGHYIGDLALNRETSELRSELEKYVNKTVRLNTHLVKALENYTFTKLHAEILETVGNTKIAEKKHIDVPCAETESSTHHEESTLDLGEMILPI